MGMLEQALHNRQWNADCHFESDKVKDEKPSSHPFLGWKVYNILRILRNVHLASSVL